ncbi:MAG: cell division protein ZapA [Rikenellaceae bacterium]
MGVEEIKITISGKSYKLNIDSSKRELYLLAERNVNSSILRFQKQNFDGFTLQDVIALAAFELAVANINIRQQNEVVSEDLAVLKALEERVGEYLNDLRHEK